MNRVAVIILNWNGIEDTLACVDSLSHQSFHDFTTVIVDNGSAEESITKLASLEKSNDNLFVLYNKTNRGFAGGVNTGIKWACAKEYEYVVLLNNDATVHFDWLKELVSPLENLPEVGVATCLLLNESGTHVDSTGEQYSKWGLPFPGNRDVPVESAPKSSYVFGASGGASIYRLTMLRDIGLFDEIFFAYYEDVDISFRAQLAGWKVYYTKQSIAYHQKGITSKKIPGFTVRQTFKNLPMLLVKNVPLQLIPSVGIRFFVAYHLMFIKALGGPARGSALRGYIQSIVYLPRCLWLRIRIQHKKTVSLYYIKSILWDDLPPHQAGLRKLFRRSNY